MPGDPACRRATAWVWTARRTAGFDGRNAAIGAQKKGPAWRRADLVWDVVFCRNGQADNGFIAASTVTEICFCSGSNASPAIFRDISDSFPPSSTDLSKLVRTALL